jgi:hypothetical protein
MFEKNFYLMLADPPWGGPTATLIDGPNLYANRGRKLDNCLSKKYTAVLDVDHSVADFKDFPPCDINDITRGFLFSRRFVELLHAHHVGNIQYFDAEVTFAPTGKKLEYKVANIIGKVMGLDLGQSDIEIDEDGDIVDVNSMVFDESKLDGQKMIRLAESVVHVVVHRSIKEAIENAGLIGVKFVTDNEFMPSMI